MIKIKQMINIINYKQIHMENLIGIHGIIEK